MGKPFTQFLSAMLEGLLKWFGKGRLQPPPAQPSTPPDSADEPARIVTSRVLLLVYDPVMDPASGRRLSQLQGWRRLEELVPAFTVDLVETSAGMARYQIVQRLDLDEFPAKVDGFRYTPATYMDVLRGARPPHTPDQVDYQAILSHFNVLQRVALREIDEVWAFAFPHAGFYESVMGGAGAFWCNAPPLKNTDQCPRRFIVMGFSYERGVGEMLEAFGHRVESMMERVFTPANGGADLWQRFTRYDLVAPGQAQVGNIHFAPNSERDYDWNNPRLVPSGCDDWYHFPHFKNLTRQVNADEWGNGDIRLHHKWWLDHLPRVAGRLNGVHNNWWQYIMDPNQVPV
jgi:hypothetical protein